MVTVLDDRRMEAEERLRVDPHVDAWREVVRLVLGVLSHERGMFLALVQVQRQTVRVVEDLRQAVEAGVGRCVLRAHDRVRRRLHRFFQV